MRYRKLGRTDFEVSEIGYGAWGIGGSQWLGGNDDESVRALKRAIDLGVNLIDTALAYGEGHSEKLVGQVVRESRRRIFVATKVPPKNRIWPAQAGVGIEDVFPYDYIVGCAEQSLRNLRMETVDLLQLHVWRDEWTGRDEWKRAFDDLRRSGKIRAAGVSLNDHDPDSGLGIINTGLIDAVQVIYNIFDQAPEDELFGRTERDGIGVIARVPFDEGTLTGTLTAGSNWPEGDWRNTYFGAENLGPSVERAQRLEAAVGGRMPLTELALRFILRHPAVSTVIPGMRKPAHVRANLAVSDGQPFDDGLLAQLREHRWDRAPAWWSG